MIASHKIELDAFGIKLIAVATMTIDHIAALGFPMTYEQYLIFRIIGRISAPLFLFLIVEGLRHTRSKLQFAFRLYLAGGLITISNIIIEGILDNGTSFGNILPTFMYVALYVICIDKIKHVGENKSKKEIYVAIFVIIASILFSFITLNMNEEPNQGIIGVILRIVVPSLFEVDYSLIFVLLGIAWYYINETKNRIILFAILSLVVLATRLMSGVDIVAFLPFNFYQMFVGTQWCMIFAIPFFMMYNGQKGLSHKYLFYIYYPIHQYILAFLVLIIT